MEEGRALRAWLENDYHSGMGWMANPCVREDPRKFLAGARSVIVVGLNCHRAAEPAGEGYGRIARYATAQDYHGFIRRKLQHLLRMVQEIAPCRGRAAVDSAPILERALAVSAGLGWFGRNSCLVSPLYGPWLMLGELVVDLALELDGSGPSRCGTCTRCLEACPTGAIVAPGIVDSRRCIAYLTIEEREAIPPSLRKSLGNWLFGCDLCQEACPWGKPTREGSRLPGRHATALWAADFLAHTDESFRRAYEGSPLMRAGRRRMARNAAVVLGNRLSGESLPVLERALADPDSLIRAHTAWALGRYGCRKELKRRLAEEDSPAVREEMESALRGEASDGGELKERIREGSA